MLKRAFFFSFFFYKKAELNSNLASYLPLAGGTISGPIIFNNNQSNNLPTHYISAGGGFSANSGKDGIKLICCDQSNAITGIGQDLSGSTYDLSIVACTSGSIDDHCRISFVKHSAGDPKTYKTLGYFDTNGNLTLTGRLFGEIWAISSTQPANRTIWFNSGTRI